MNKLLIYPYQEELSSICRYCSLLEKYSEVQPVSPRGFGLEGQDASKVDGGEQVGIQVTSDFLAALGECDGVFLDLAVESSLSATHYQHAIESSISQNKNVTITETLWSFLLENGVSEKQLANVGIVGYTHVEMAPITKRKLYDLPIPCITVLGVGNKCNKFALQLGIAGYFRKKGYNVALFGSKEFSSLFGFDSLPAFLFAPGSQKEKILRLNHFVYEKVKEKDADIVVIGCPGSIMQETPLEFEEYGELAFVIGNAFTADASVLSLYAGTYDEQAIEYLQQLCRFRNNAEVFRLNLACKNMLVDQATTALKAFTLELDFVRDKILPQVAAGNCELYTALAEKDMERLGKSLEAEMLNNV